MAELKRKKEISVRALGRDNIQGQMLSKTLHYVESGELF